MLSALDIKLTASLCTIAIMCHIRNNFDQFFMPNGIIRLLLHWSGDHQFLSLLDDIVDHIVSDASNLELIVQLNLHVLFFWCAFNENFGVLVKFNINYKDS